MNAALLSSILYLLDVKSCQENQNFWSTGFQVAICIEIKILRGVSFKRNIKIWLFQKVGKSQNKVGVAKEIGCGNDKALNKFCRGKDMRQKNRQIDR